MHALLYIRILFNQNDLTLNVKPLLSQDKVENRGFIVVLQIEKATMR